jgi:hypothetical protein
MDHLYVKNCVSGSRPSVKWSLVAHRIYLKRNSADPAIDDDGNIYALIMIKKIIGFCPK